MVQTAEQKKRLRYKEDLLNNREPPTRTETNRRLLEEVRTEVAKEVAEGKKQIRAEAAKDRKSVQQAGSVAVQHIKDIAEAEKQNITDHAKAAAQEALKKATKRPPVLSAAEARNADSSASSAAFTTSPTMSAVTEPEASRPSSKRPIQAPDTRPSTVVLLQRTEAFSTPAHKDKRVDNEEAAQATKKAVTILPLLALRRLLSCLRQSRR